MASGKRIWCSRLMALLVVLYGVGDPGSAATAEQPDGQKESGELIARPLWEFGVGGTVLYGPDYPASDEYHLNGIGAPLFIYRGRYFRLGDGSIAEAIALNTETLEFNLSFSASFKADSGDNKAREDMPDLDYLGGVGPQVIAHAARRYSPEIGLATVDILLPVRAVFSTDLSSAEHRGFVAQPGVRYKHRFPGDHPFRFKATASTIFANEELMDYFYGVRRKYARADRKEFDASAGYLGSELRLSMSKEVLDGLHFFLGGRFGLYTGAKNEDSPLFTSDYGAAVSLSMLWSFYTSDETVSVDW